VLPFETVNEPPGERIVYQPSGLSNISKALRRHGSLEQWRAMIKDLPPTGRFTVCASLTTPFQYQAKIESGGFHLYDRTSTGKTTLLQAGASVWGDGCDPQLAGGRDAMIKRWNATANALEGIAEAHNDLPLPIDEIGEGDRREFGSTIYRLFSGTGRGRAKRDGSLSDAKSWRMSILSAGELPVAEYLTEGGGRVRGGQLVRLVDIGLGDTFPDAKSADRVKHGCAEHFGHAGPDLLKAEGVLLGWSTFNHDTIGKARTTEAERVRKRFALVAHVGIKAATAGILPWNREEILEAVRIAYQSWASRSTGVSDAERGLVNVANFILAHGASRFELDSATVPVRDRAGWFRGGRYHFTPEAFKEACNGAPVEATRKAIKARGWLHTNEAGRLTSTIRHQHQTVRVTSVETDLLTIVGDESPDFSGVAGDTGVSRATAGDSADTTTGDQVVSPVSGTGATPPPDTTDTGSGGQVVSGSARATKGATPPTPPTPPKSTFRETI
jgi:putative DNA primase/helicase